MTTILTINRKKFFQVVSPQFLENLGVFLSLFIYFDFFVTGCFSQVSMVGNRGKNYLNIFYTRGTTPTKGTILSCWRRFLITIFQSEK